MASRRHQRRRSCERKKRHDTEDEARREMAYLQQGDPGPHWDCYKCRFCQGWHVTGHSWRGDWAGKMRGKGHAHHRGQAA